MEVKRRASILMVFALLFFSQTVQGETMILHPKDSDRVENISWDNKGRATLKTGCTWGYCLWNVRVPKGRIASLTIETEESVKRNDSTGGKILCQIRWLSDGKWSAFWPENILSGGDFKDSNGNGLPDCVQVLDIGSKNKLWSDSSEESLPEWVDEHITEASPSLVVSDKGRRFVRFEKILPEGQVILQMRSDRILPGNTYTVSGWNGWELGETHTMGLMSRFHEIDEEGNRLNKIMLIGDDDWHQPGGDEPLKWRAVTFTARGETVRLNLYPMRLIASAGVIKASEYWVRGDSLSSYQGRSIAKFDFTRMDGWEYDEAVTVVDKNGLLISPRPHTNSFGLSPEFSLPRVERIGFSVGMEVEVPERYNDHDPSHKAWASTYLELLDRTGQLLDVIKISVCRPNPNSSAVLASAGQVPEGATRARIRLVASHQSYLPEEMKQNMDGEMTCTWKEIEVFESLYPTEFRPRLDEDSVVQEGEIPTASEYEVRALLFSDGDRPSPELKSICLSINEDGQ